MTKKIALITGANKGIGLEIGRQLGQQGIIVLLGPELCLRRRTQSHSCKPDNIEAYPLN